MALLAVNLGALIGFIVVLAVIIAAAIVWTTYRAKNTHKVGPNEVLIVSGDKPHTVTDPDGKKREVAYRMYIGGSSFVDPYKESASVLPLDIFTIQIKTEDVMTSAGIPIHAIGVAQVKVKSDDADIRLAAEQFLGKGSEGIKEVAGQIIEGYMRAQIGGMSVEEIFQQRDEFSANVAHAAEKDFQRMGVTCINYSIKEISDSQGYLDNLGKPKIAEARRKAEIAEAEAKRETIVKSSEARKEGDIAKLRAETEVTAASTDFELKRAEFQANINSEKAKADMAYELQKQKMLQSLKREELSVQLVEKQMRIKVEEQEVERKEKELDAQVKKPAEARKFQVMTEADAEAYRAAEEYKGKIAGIKLKGLAEAEVAKAMGSAEAGAMREKAGAWAEYNQAAMYQTLIEKLPELARAVSEPLSNIDRVVMIGSGEDIEKGPARLTGQIGRVLAQLPEVVSSLTDIDLVKLAESLPKKKEEADS